MRAGGSASSGSAAGLKYVVNFSVEGSGEDQLKRIVGLFDAVGAAADSAGRKGGGGVGELSAGIGALSDQVKTIGKAEFLREGFEKLGDVGTNLIGIGVGFAEAWVTGFESVIEKGSELEQVLLRMRATGRTREEARGMVEDTLKAASQLPLTELEAARIVQGMALAHVDSFKQIGQSYEELAKKGKTIPELMDVLPEKMKKTGSTALSLISDVLATTGKIGDQMGINQLMTMVETGFFAGRARFGALTGELRAVSKASGGAQGRLLALQQVLEKTGALGASAAAMGTLSGQLTNLRGVLDLVVYRIMDVGKSGGLMDRFVKGFGGLVNTVREFFDTANPESEKFLESLKGIGTMLMDVLVPATEKFAGLVKSVFTWVADNPALTKTIVAVSFLAAGFSVLAGAALVLGSALGVLLTTLFIVPEALLIFPLAIGAAIAGIVAFVGALGLVGAAIEAWEDNLGGIKDFFEDIELIMSAFMEGFKTWHDGVFQISVGTAEKLKKRGLMETFLSIGNVMYQVQEIWEGVTEGLKMAWADSGAAISDSLGRIKDAVGTVFGYFVEQVGTGQDAVDRTRESAGTLGERVRAFADDVAAGITASIPTVEAMADKFVDWYFDLKMVGHYLDILGGIAKTVFGWMELSLLPILGSIEMIVDAVRILYNILTGDWSNALHIFKTLGSFTSKVAMSGASNLAGGVMDAATGTRDALMEDRQGDAERMKAGMHAQFSSWQDSQAAIAGAKEANAAGVGVEDEKVGGSRGITAEDLKELVAQLHRKPQVNEVKLYLDGKQIKTAVDQHTGDAGEAQGGNMIDGWY